MTEEEKAIDLTSKSFELEKDKVEWFCSTYKNSRMSEIHTFYNGVLVGLTEGRKENEKAKELIKTLLLIADNKVSQLEFLLCIADAEQFLNKVVE